ncbi:MAG: DUF459 domain-containing protein [Lentisphaerae bacterium]|nr:DUF459 domain-containing protein [Lentisphaerota bacterium]
MMPSPFRWMFRTTVRPLALSCLPVVLPVLIPFLPSQAESAPTTQVVLLGDSTMRALAHSLERELAKQPGFSAFTFTSLGSGLARLDMFDWLAKVDEVTKAKKPDIVVIMIGANDKQAMQTQTKLIQPGAPEWNWEYARRVGVVLDIMIAAGVKRIFWIELPDMRQAKLQEDSLLINMLVQKEAESRPQVAFQSSKKILSRTPGVFSPYIFDANGMPLQVRDADGVHLNRNGADLLAREIVSRILKTQTQAAP